MDKASKPHKQKFQKPLLRAGTQRGLESVNGAGSNPGSRPASSRPPSARPAALDTPRDEETQPRDTLLRRENTLGTTSAKEAEDVRGHFDYPTPASITLMQMALSLGYCAYMSTSWVYCTILHKTLFPPCAELWGGHLTAGAMGCFTTSLLFWTFPLFCCIVLLLYFYRDLLHTRLYYEMFAHRVHIDFMNIGFFQSFMVQIMIAWWLCTLLKYPLTGTLTFQRILLTLPFWIPVASFTAMLYTQWDLESRLLTVAKFVETDVEWANEHMAVSYFIRDYEAEVAYKNVAIELNKEKPAPRLDTGELIAKIINEAARMNDAGEEADENQASKTILDSWLPSYWVKQLLYSPYLHDKHAQNFHTWYRMYFIFTCVMILILLVLATMTVITLLKDQALIAESIVTDWLALDYFGELVKQVPVAPPGTSESGSTSMKVTEEALHHVRGSIAGGTHLAPHDHR